MVKIDLVPHLHLGLKDPVFFWTVVAAFASFAPRASNALNSSFVHGMSFKPAIQVSNSWTKLLNCAMTIAEDMEIPR